MSDIEEAYIDELNCPICQEPYGEEEHNPRNLPCGHTFCSHCIHLILEDFTPLCPDCRKIIPKKAIESFPVSYIVKKMIDSYKTIYDKIHAEVLHSALQCSDSSPTPETNSESTDDGEDEPFYSSSASSSTNLAVPSNGSCSDHHSPENFFCSYHDAWICGACAFLNHKNEDECEVTFASTNLDLVKIENMSKIKRQKNNLKSSIKILEKFKNLTFDLYSNGKAPKENVRDINAVLSKVSKNIKEISGSYEMLEDVEQLLREETDTEKWQLMFNNFWECQSYPKSKNDFLWNLWPLIKLSVDCFDSGKHTTCLYSEWNGQTYYSEIISKDSYTYFSSLKAKPFDENTYPIFLKDIETEAPFSHGFMELCLETEDNYLGKITFELLTNKSRIRQFIALCLGSQGLCYRGTHFFQKSGSLDCFLEGGDYENDNGTGGKGFFDINDYDPKSYDLQKGIICGPPHYYKNIASQFKICYGVANPALRARGPIAQIVEGFEIISKIVEMSFDDCKKVFVRECGVCYKKQTVQESPEEIYSERK